MKIIIYCRVSTKEQADKGYSLEAQEDDCRKFAINNGYEIDKVFVERGESAKTQDRTELQKIIKYSIENKKDISALIVWKFDRFARNLSDQMELCKNFARLGIRVLSATENNEDTSVGKLMRNIIGSFAQYENDVKSERTTQGMIKALKLGRWCWKAPHGYKRIRDVYNKPLLYPNEDAPYITEIFSLAETGLYKQIDIVAIVKKKGFKGLTRSLINRISRNHLYASLIKHDWLDEVVDAIHKPLVSKETFFKVQMILDGKKPRVVTKIRNHPDFPLRNFIRCPKCENKLTGGWSTGRKGVKYAYYRCKTKGCSLNLKKGQLEGNFYTFLKEYQPDRKVLDLFEQVVLDVWKTRHQESVKEFSRVKGELKQLEEKRKRVEELVIDKTFDEETYKQKAQDIKSEIMIKTIELNDGKIEADDIEACVEYCKYILGNIAELWANGDLNLKQRFQTFIFPEKIYCEGETFRTTKTAFIFKQLQSKSLPQSHLASPRGFEPLLPP